MGAKVGGPVAIEKARTVGDGRCSPGEMRQGNLGHRAQRISLVMVEEEISLRGRRKIREPARYPAEPLRRLVRIRRAQSYLPELHG